MGLSRLIGIWSRLLGFLTVVLAGLLSELAGRLLFGRDAVISTLGLFGCSMLLTVSSTSKTIGSLATSFTTIVSSFLGIFTLVVTPTKAGLTSFGTNWKGLVSMISFSSSSSSSMMAGTSLGLGKVKAGLRLTG